MNSRLVDLSRAHAVQSRLTWSSSAFAFLGLALWRFSMTERAPSKRG